jgi:hypothetical protein
MEAVLSLLPMKAFVLLVSNLMIDQRAVVRRKMLEVFNAKLQQSQDQFFDENIIKGKVYISRNVIRELKSGCRSSGSPLGSLHKSGGRIKPC